LSCQYNNDLKCLPVLPYYLVYLDVSKTIVCVPNIVKNVTIDTYEGFVSKTIKLPLCNDLRPPPCDTFPRDIALKDSLSAANPANSVFKKAIIDVFPNPTEGVVKIKCTNCSVKKVSVFNTFGQLVIQINANVLNFSDLAAGMYLVRVETESGEKTVRKIMRL
jgi:hypothetical protein